MSAQLVQPQPRLPAAAHAGPATAPTTRPGSRILYIDNLRILLICGVVVQHLSVTYGASGSWMYIDPATDQIASTILSVYNLLPMAVGMGFFFLLAGYFTPRSVDRKSGVAFLRDRIIRLGIPWVVYSLLLEPLVVYIARGQPGSFWSFYPVYLHRVDSIADGPIWFVELLLFFSILYVAWRWLTRSRPRTASGAAAVRGYRAVLTFTLALGLASFVVRVWWPQYYQPSPLNLPLGYLLQYACFYSLGIVAYRGGWFSKITFRMGRDWALVALLITLLFYGLVLPYVAITGRQAVIEMLGGWHWLSLVYALWESFVIIGVSLGLIVLFRQRVNHQGRLAKDLAASAYTVYLIHPVVLVGFAYTFHVVALYPLLKFGIAALITVPLCFLLSSGLRRIPVLNKVL